MRRRFLVCWTLLLLVTLPSALLADDVVVRPSAGDGFVIEAAPGGQDRFRFSETGEVFKDGNLFLHDTFVSSLYLGAFAGDAATGTSNTAFGAVAMRSATGFGNTAVGFGALRDNTTGIDNVAVGRLALSESTVGPGNSAVGNRALENATLGFSNTAVGDRAMREMIDGSNNVAVGVLALASHTDGRENVSVGSAALSGVSKGDENIAIGYLAGTLLDTGDDNVYIANRGSPVETGRIRIGTDGIQTRTAIAGDVSLGDDSTTTLLGLRGPDDGLEGPIVTLSGDTTDQVESGRLRFVEGTASVNFRGAYIHYDGSANRLHIGTHNTSDQVVANDVNAITVLRSTGRVGLRRDSPSHPLHVGTNTSTGNGAHVTAGGVWTNGSSRTFKEGFAAVDAQEVLSQVAALPITRWRYKGEDASEHVGPVAEDFHAAFGLGGDERYIGTVDADGVAFASIQALHALAEEQRQLIEDQRAQLETQQQGIDQLMERIAALEAASGAASLKGAQ